MSERPPRTAVRRSGGEPIGPDAARSLETLTTVLVVVIVVAILYLAREILVPLAIAVLMSFVLSPLVKLLRGIGVGKRVAVGLVVLAAFLTAVGLGAILAKQISDLAADAPNYRATVERKIGGLKDFAAHNPLVGKLDGMIADVSRLSPATSGKTSGKMPDKPNPVLAQPAGGSRSTEPTSPTPVEIVSPMPGVLTIVQAVAGVAATPLATAAFVAIFVVFILLQREDLRNRFIRLFGFGDIQRATAAMNDAARRLSRYFLAQVLLNTVFGLVVATVLAIIGVPGAVLWGIVAIFMRFIPYVGTVGAVLFPLAMAAAAGPGWSMTIEVAILFGVAESITGQVVEPLVYGHNTGISPIAVVGAATFWTWLWGPVGLVLSTPLTVCLVVMGRHVERLSFLDVLLGDAPALTPIETFYQRMLAGDPAEIVDHADAFLREGSLVDYCDQVALPALLMAQADARRGTLDETRQIRIRDTMKGLVEDLGDAVPPAATIADAARRTGIEAPAPLDETSDGVAASAPVPEPTRIDPAWAREGAVLCVAGRTPLDEAAADLLADLLGRQGVGARVEGADSLVGARQAPRVDGVKLVVLSFLDADMRVAQARFAVRRLRRLVPGRPVVSALWIGGTGPGETAGRCAEVRGDACVSNLTDAIAFCLERAASERAPDAHTPDDDPRGAAPAPERAR